MTDKGALRYDTGKLRFSLIPVEILVELSRLYTKGAIKYAAHNWRKGMDWSRCIDSAERHWIKWRAGLTTDPETGCHHLTAVAWNVLTLLVYSIQGIGHDDRVVQESVVLNEDMEWVNRVKRPQFGPENEEPTVRLRSTSHE